MAAFAWTTDIREAEFEQKKLRDLVRIEQTGILNFECGLAVGTAYDPNSGQCVAIGVSFAPGGQYQREYVSASAAVDFEYLPGFLAFRMGPAVCELLDRVKLDDYQVLLFDGQGIAHQRGLGLASHIGVLYDMPSVGVTHRCLFGRYHEPSRQDAAISDVSIPWKSSEIIGRAVRVRAEDDPFFVSPGHKCAVGDAAAFALSLCGPNFSYPKPLRRAHSLANATARTLWDATS